MKVVVVGGGLAGVAAALAARGAGAEVVVLAGPPGASALTAGAWDVAMDPKVTPGDRTDARPTVRQAARRLAALRGAHPLARLGLAAAVDAHAAVLPALALYEDVRWDAPLALVATELGGVRTTATAQVSVLRLDALRPDGRVAVAALGGHPAASTRALAESLEEWSRTSHAGLTFFPVDLDFLEHRSDALLPPHEVSRRVEDPAGTARLGAALAAARARTPFEAALVPAVLGVQGAQAIAARLRALVGAPVGEMLSGPGTPQGLRLLAALGAALTGFERISTRVIGVHIDGGRARSVLLEDGSSVSADAVILATGRFLGGGLVKMGAVREVILDLPLYLDGRAAALADTPHGTDPTTLFDEDLFGRHAALRMGVGWDDSLRPLGANGRAAAENLFAAGDLLEGHDPTTDLSGLGVAATTGHWAGRWASRS